MEVLLCFCFCDLDLCGLLSWIHDFLAAVFKCARAETSDGKKLFKGNTQIFAQMPPRSY
jgi:hypothetical protein